jgi:hypothetical protein
VSARIRPRLVSAASVLLLLTFGVQPVLADTELGHTGTVGFHRLRESVTNYGGAVCIYRSDPPPSAYSYEGELYSLEVRPPKVKAIAGAQQVGWRFIVERRSEDELAGAWFPWVERIRSKIQRRTTDTNTNAPFTWMQADVIVPTNGVNDTPRYQYRVLVKMYWFYADGSIEGTATHRVDWYTLAYEDQPVTGDIELSLDQQPCFAWVGKLSETP